MDKMEDVELDENKVLSLSAAVACTSAFIYRWWWYHTVFYFYSAVHDITQMGQLRYFVYTP